MTLAEMKDKIYNLHMMYISNMHHMIKNPEELTACGYKTLEQYLVSTIKHIQKETENCVEHTKKLIQIKNLATMLLPIMVRAT